MRLGRDRTKGLHLKLLVIAAVIASPVVAPVTSALAQSSVTGSNDSSGADAKSGDANGTNSSSSQTGPSSGGSNQAGAQDVNNSTGTNVQDGNNRTTVSQTTNVKTGDAVAGQVIGGVVGRGGSLVIDATNHSEDVEVTTGDAEGSNNARVITGLVAADDGAFVGDALDRPAASVSDLQNVVGRNIQDGNNAATVRQRTNVQTGDGVGGQVIGAVVNGGTTDIAASNTTRDTTIETGEADAHNGLSAFVGLVDADTATVVDTADVTNAIGSNVQDGNNRLSASQSARSATGDGVGGQVLGVVSAGATRVDASNITEDSTIETGAATSGNDAAGFVGLVDADTVTVQTADLTGVVGSNLQDGNNTSRLNQSADAVTGDAVAGQVAGVVTSAGGSAAVTLANRSEGIDATSGESDFFNDSSLFNGLSTTGGSASVGAAADTALSTIFSSAVS